MPWVFLAGALAILALFCAWSPRFRTIGVPIIAFLGVVALPIAISVTLACSVLFMMEWSPTMANFIVAFGISLTAILGPLTIYLIYAFVFESLPRWLFRGEETRRFIAGMCVFGLPGGAAAYLMLW